MQTTAAKPSLNDYEVVMRHVAEPWKQMKMIVRAISSFAAKDIAHARNEIWWQAMHIRPVSPAASLPTTDDTPGHAGV